MNELHFWNLHWMLTIFELIVRDRADRSGCSNHQFDQSDSVKKYIWHFLALWFPPGGKFFGPFERPLTVDDFHKSALCRYGLSFMVKMAFDSVID